MEKILSIPLTWLIGLIIILGSLVYVTLIERFWVEVRPVGIAIAKLPASMAGLRIVLFSDVHVGFYYENHHLRKLVDQINEQKPDVICFTGDLLDSRDALPMIQEASRELARLQAPLGKFAVLGNHDYRTDADQIAKHLQLGGFKLLVNQSDSMVHNGGRLNIVGVDDAINGNPDLAKALQGVSEQAPTILLVHEPDYAAISSKFPIDLQLSGHSHGGQVRIPFGGPVLTSRLGKNYNAGEYKLHNMTIYTTRGIGTTILPVRFFSRPEITVITLQQQK
ncbi:metallophosphoesterase [Brevibacillus ginsengisoli]|uniref:metallophosphoesterase n=1 Tax=Brevibacillus ginsengisoli TaxID=363854 RepID=UPI003CF79936